MHFRHIIALFLTIQLLPTVRTGFAQESDGTVYVAGNEVTGNRILQFLRAENGTLTPGGAFPTGGLGTGGGLGNQGGVVLTDDGQWLLVVNAGSDDVSVFAVDFEAGSLRLVDRKTSGGRRPISIASKGKLVYVLNAGGAVGA